MNHCYKHGMFHVGRANMWGSYCPETGEYYLAHDTYVHGVGKCTGVLASARYVRDDDPDSWQEQVARGYSYEVVRELLRLGHLTPKTLALFLAEDGEVWWDYQPPQPIAVEIK